MQRFLRDHGRLGLVRRVPVYRWYGTSVDGVAIEGAVAGVTGVRLELVRRVPVCRLHRTSVEGAAIDGAVDGAAGAVDRLTELQLTELLMEE